MEEKKFEISAQLLDSITRFLSQMPYQQVAPLMNQLQGELQPQIQAEKAAIESKKLDKQE